MTFPTRYLPSTIASAFGAIFLYGGVRFGDTAHAAPASIAERATPSIVEFVSGAPAVLFSLAGAGLLIWAAVYAVYVSNTNSSRY